MAYIAKWLADRAQTKVVDNIIDSTHKDVTMADPVLDEYFPVKMHPDFKYLGLILEKYNILASIIGVGGRAPTTRIGSWKEVNQDYLKVGLDFVFDEMDQRRMEEVQRMANLQGITVGSQLNPDGTMKVQGESDTLASFIFGRAIDLVKSVNLLNSKLIYDVLQTGQINHTDARTNIVHNLNYVDPNETFVSFPSALAGNDRWDQYATAKPLTDLENDCWAYEEANGTQPKATLMSKILYRHIWHCQSVIDQASTFSSSISASKMNPAILTRVLEDRGLPPIILSDRRYDYLNAEGQRQKGRFLNTNRYVFLCEEMGERGIGPTIESKGGDVNAKPKPGVWLNTKQDPYIPTNDIMECAANILPLVYNPRYLFSRQAFTI